jgi:PKHD-type hydroxylase
MISNYLKNKNSLESLDATINVDELHGPSVDYWYLKSRQYHTYIWKTDVFTDYQIEKIKAIGKLLIQERSSTGGFGKDCLQIRRSFNSWIPINNQTQWIYQILTDHVNQVNEDFFQFDLEKIEKLQFTHYKSDESGFYAKHLDPLVWNVPHNRMLSITIQLSSPEEYEGGDFALYYEDAPTIIEKQKGMSIFFPSHTLHEVTPVTKGERYSLVAWVHGK